MTTYTLKISADELDLLKSLTADQLFRREFIDPKMPGHRRDTTQLSLGKAILQRLSTLSPDPDKPARQMHRHAV